MLAETTAFLAKGQLKVAGFNPHSPTSAANKVNIEAEAADFARTLKFLRVTKNAEVIIPNDTEVSPQVASSSVFKELDSIRESAKTMIGIGSVATETSEKGTPAPKLTMDNIKALLPHRITHVAIQLDHRNITAANKPVKQDHKITNTYFQSQNITGQTPNTQTREHHLSPHTQTDAHHVA